MKKVKSKYTEIPLTEEEKIKRAVDKIRNPGNPTVFKKFRMELEYEMEMESEETSTSQVVYRWRDGGISPVVYCPPPKKGGKTRQKKP